MEINKKKPRLRNITSTGKAHTVRIQHNNALIVKKFDFMPLDPDHRELALRKAICFRDNKALLSDFTNTGYKNLYIKQDINGWKIILHTKIVSVFHHVFRFNNKDKSYTDALNKALAKLCKINKFDLPFIIDYNTGLYHAGLLGYTKHSNDSKFVIRPMKVSGAVYDDMSNQVGIVRTMISEITVVAAFDSGNPFRLIVNKVLYNNLMKLYTTQIELLDMQIVDGVDKILKGLINYEIDELKNKVEELKKELKVATYGFEDNIGMDEESLKDLCNKINKIKEDM